MRIFAACLVGVLGFGVLSTLAACSDSTDTGSAGAGGAGAGAAGKAGSGGNAGSGKAGAGGDTSTAGETSAAGDTSAAGEGGGANECAFYSEACTNCFIEKCAAASLACYAVASCQTGVQTLSDCACTPGNDPTQCLATFVSENGDPAEQLANCYSLNCEAACQ
jgi:hypothetical protein